VTNSSVKNSDVIIHEAIHALRQFDADRDPRLKHVKHYWGKDADLEESLTDGETTGRQRPFERTNYHSGYYHFLKIPLPDSKTGALKAAGEMVTEDRVTITGEVQKGLKGKRVQKAIVLKYPMTNIAHLKLKGPAEAIDTYREVERSLPGKEKPVTTHVQMYKPDAHEGTDRAQDKDLMAETPGKITQWEDGSPELVREKQKIGDIKIKSMGNKTVRELVEEGKIQIIPHYNEKTGKWTVKAEKLNITDQMMNEVIIYGGLPVRRKDVYKDALEVTGDKKAADMFAFGTQTKLAPKEWQPLTYDQLQKIKKGESMGTPKASKGYKWKDDSLVFEGSGNQIGRVHKVNDGKWYTVMNGSVVGEFKTRKEASDHVEGFARIMFEGTGGSGGSRKPSSTFRRTMPKGAAPRKVKTRSGGGKKVGPYFTRSGKVSRHRI
jgi:hypothetical protein